MLAAALPCHADALRPNIVFIFADDLGYGEVGAYGEPDILTPRIDRLADEGMRFTQAYATAPLCAPSRCGLMLGQHTGHCTVNRNYGPNIPLRIEDVTVAELLQGAGYDTALDGKWGLGGQWSVEMGSGPVNLHSVPELKGFDHSLVYRGHGVAHYYYTEELWLDGESYPILENAGGAEEVYSHDLFTEDALDYITAAATDPDPFYLQLSYTIPHRRHEVPELGPYEEEDWPEVERRYAAMVTRMDTDIGEIVDLVDSLGIGDRTLFVFASDNGPPETTTDGMTHEYDFFGGAGPLRGNKADLYEGGIRVPLIARWTGTIQAGEVSDLICGMQDFLPTAAELAGTSAPQGVDGLSLVPQLTGTGTQEQHDHLVFTAHGSQFGEGGPPSDGAVRWGDYKLVLRSDGVVELYDLAADVGETTDIADDHPTVVEEMLSILAAEDTGPPTAALPRAELLGDVTAEGELPDPSGVTAVYLRFEGADGATADEVEDDSDDVANDATAVHDPVYADDVFGAEVPRTGEINTAYLRLDASGGQYLTIPHHPIVSFGNVPFTIEAWVRLDQLASGLSSEDRQFLVLKKEELAGDETLGYGFLVQAGAYALAPNRFGKTEDLTGRELLLMFGSGSVTDEDKWALISHLEIEDDGWHHVAVVFDPDADEARFYLDGVEDVVEYEDDCHISPCHYENQGSLVIGIHHSENGAYDIPLDGALDELRISRGALPADELLRAAATSPTPEPMAYTLDFGELDVGTEAVEACVQVANTAQAYAHLLVGEVLTDGMDDPRLTATTGSFGPIPDGGATDCFAVTFDPATEGPLEGQTIQVAARAYTYGFDAVGAPIELQVTGSALQDGTQDDDGDDDGPDDDDGSGVDGGCGCEVQRRAQPWGLLACALALAARRLGRR